MAQHYLDKLFRPASIAVFGASSRANSTGMKIFKNLLDAKFPGKIYAINPKHKSVFHQPCFGTLDEIHQEIDLAIIATPANTIPSIIAACGRKGIENAIITSSGFSETGKDGKDFEKHLLNIAGGYHLRLLGPNCLGIMRPSYRMNATFDFNFPTPGNLALVSQSDAFTAGILDWSFHKKIGFSAIISLGNSADIDFADVLDYLTTDTDTHSILLHIEKIHHARRFMSALRVAARMKPVIVIKSGKFRKASYHSVNPICEDDVFDAALHRAGAVKVMTIEELFLAAEILASPYRMTGNRLTIISNGESLGVMAADYAINQNIAIAELSLTKALEKILPAHWSKQNPIDIMSDATPYLYRETLDICIEDKNSDGILVVLSPVALTEPLKVAEHIIAVSEKTDKPIMAAFVGENLVKSSWDLLASHRIPYFDMPEKAIKAFSYLASYKANQELLLQVSEPFSFNPKPNISLGKNIIEKVKRNNRASLHHEEARMMLQAFGISTMETAPSHQASAFIINVAHDAVFGPVIRLGISAGALFPMDSLAYALPPLNSFLAKQLIEKSHIANILKLDTHKILNILLCVSEMICEIPEIKTIEIQSPLMHNMTSEIFNVEMTIDQHLHAVQRYSHMAIHPYPNQLIKTIKVSGESSVTIRPIRPEDAEMTQAFMRNLSSQSRYFRFMQHIRELTSNMLVRLTQIDYDREMTFIATIPENEEEIGIGLAHYVTNPDRESCEFAIVIADAWQNKGIGSNLMNALTSEAKSQKLSIMIGFVIATNTSMLELTQRLGFIISNSDDPTVKIVTRYL